MPEGKFSNRRCPKCGASLLTDGRAFWCASVVAGQSGDPSDRVCRYRAESEIQLDQHQPGQVPAPAPVVMRLVCENGHAQTIRFLDLPREYVLGMAGLLDGTSPLYVYPPGSESLIGKCGICRAQIRATVE